MALPPLMGASAPPITALILGSRSIPDYSPRIATLLDDVPGSRIVAVDIEPDEACPAGWEFSPAFIGRPSTGRMFYHANAPICSSLYRPNWDCMNQYDDLSSLAVLCAERVNVISLDEFTQGKRPIHFIGADIQGAELEAFTSGPLTLADTLMIQAEAQVAPMYEGAPMWRDLDAGLDAMGFMLYRPIAYQAFPEVGLTTDYGDGSGRCMWGEFLYVRKDYAALGADALLRLAVLSHIHGQRHLATVCLERAAGRAVAEEYVRLVRPALATPEKGEKE